MEKNVLTNDVENESGPNLRLCVLLGLYCTPEEGSKTDYWFYIHLSVMWLLAILH